MLNLYPHFNLTLHPLPPPPATSSWIQVNLNQTRKVTGIVIQGCPQGDHWLTKFKLQHSMDGATWTDHTADGAVSEQIPATLKHCQEVSNFAVQRQTVELKSHRGFLWFPVFARLNRQKHSWHSATGHTCISAVHPHPPSGVQRSGRPSLWRLRVHTGL